MRAPAENRAKASGRNGRFPSRTFTASWRPCIQTTRDGRHRRHGHPSDRPCRPVQRVLPKRIRRDIRTRRTSPERPNRPASRAFDVTWLSRNANETPSSLIREPGHANDAKWRHVPQPSSGPATCHVHEEEGTPSERHSSQGETIPPRRPEGPARRPQTRAIEKSIGSRVHDFMSRPGFDRDRDWRESMPFNYDFRMRIAAPRPTVFERLLRIEHLSRWFCGWCRIEPKVGGSFKFGGETCILPPEGRAWETTIDEGDVLRRFAFIWPIRSVKTRATYELEDGSNDTTLLHVSHRGVPIRTTTCGSVLDAWRMCLGNLKSIAEGRGDSVRPDHSAVTDPDLKLSVLVEAAPARVFDAFADPKQLDHWSTGGMPTQRAHVDPNPRGQFSFGWPEKGPDHVLEWIPERRIALQSSQAPRHLRILFEFEQKSSGTAVYLSVVGFALVQTDEIVHERGRWSALLVSLKNLVESGDSGFAKVDEDQIQGN